MNRKQLFQVAKARIEAGYDSMICLALASAYAGAYLEGDWPHIKVYDSCVDSINSGLDGEASLSSWCSANGYNTHARSSAWFKGHSQLARMAWLDRLIEECPDEP